MSAWSEHTWRVLSGERPPLDPKSYDIRWHWKDFQLYNEIARELLAPLRVEFMDVVPMTRLRPSLDWKDWRSGKHLDCLHGNAAVYEWNTLMVNAIAAGLC